MFSLSFYKGPKINSNKYYSVLLELPQETVIYNTRWTNVTLIPARNGTPANLRENPHYTVIYVFPNLWVIM